MKENKEVTLAEIFNRLEKDAKEIEASGIFKGQNEGIACILAAGIKELMENK